MTIQSSNYKAVAAFGNTQSSSIIEKALAGDIVIVCDPATKTRAATAAAFSRDVEVRLETAAGEVHGWYNGTLAVAAADASSAGTATIEDSATEVTLVNGVGTITVEGDAAAWLAGTAQVETATVAIPGVAQVETATVVGTIGAAGVGNATVVVTAAGMTGSPKTKSVAVANNDTAAQVAEKIRTALIADADIGHETTGFFTVTGADAEIILTAKTAAANDATLNVSIDNGTCSGLTTAASSANTTAGVAQSITTSGNASVVVTAAGMTGSPKTIAVPVLIGDTASQVATKIRAALTADASVSARFTVGGTGALVSLTRSAVPKVANDGTLNIALADGTCVGITTAASSANTTAGVAAETNTLTVSKNTSVPILGSVAAATSVESII